jgi:Kef-type K+ transport system membrane component KefB
MSLTSAAVVAVLAFLAPLAVRLIRLPVPDIVIQILLGVAVGPYVLGWAGVDEPVHVLALIGLSFLLFLAGLEIDFDRLRGSVATLAFGGYVLSFALALVVGSVLAAAHLVRSPLLIAIILSATALGVIIPPLKDSGQIDTTLGRLVVAAASVAEVVPVVLLSLLFSRHSGGLGSQVALLAGFCALAAVAVLLLLGLERVTWFSRAFRALQDTTAQIRVRAAVALLMIFAALAVSVGLEAILGAFFAGAAISLVDRDRTRTHVLLRPKLQAVGFGALIPFFFVATGMSLDVSSFLDSRAALIQVPLFVAALLVVRALPAVVYAPLLSSRAEVAAAGLLQATTLSLPIVGGSIGVTLGLLEPATYLALITAALLSVIILPAAASRLATSRKDQHPVVPGQAA